MSTLFHHSINGGWAVVPLVFYAAENPCLGQDRPSLWNRDSSCGVKNPNNHESIAHHLENTPEPILHGGTYSGTYGTYT